MEMNKSPSPEKSDSARTTNVEQCSSPSQTLTQARTYECNFCKRGFSNAQALGGHMNIHRKDKAKLKQTSPLVEPPRPQQFLEIPKTTLPSPNTILSARSTIPDDRSASVAATWTWNYGSEKNDTTSDQMVVSTEPRQLPLFDETTTLKVDHDPWQKKKVDHDQDQMDSSSSSSHRGDDQDNELDLELRLGNEPGFDSSSSSSAKGTRKFF